MCNCLIYEKEVLIKYIGDEITELDMEKPWETYLGTIPYRFHTASIRWSLTKTYSRIWLERVLKNMTKDELIFWAHSESFCLDQV